MNKRRIQRTIDFVKVMKRLIKHVDNSEPQWGLTTYRFNGGKDFNRKELETILDKHLKSLGIR